MPGLDQINAIWKNIKEFELAPIRKEALRELKIVLMGEADLAPAWLTEKIRRDPHTTAPDFSSPLKLLTLADAPQAEDADLILLYLDLLREDHRAAQAACREWSNKGKKVMVMCDTENPAYASEPLRRWAPWNASRVLCGPFEQDLWLQEVFVPAVLQLLPDFRLALGRQFSLFRVPIAHQLIKETCYNNAAYALGAGLAEVVPVLNLPLNVTDMIVLTKAQAFLVYRLGLLLGFSTAWQDYLAEFSSVIGGGFIWRQLARYLVGMIPIWGIVPKVAVAYAGTYVVGNAVLQWYLTGRHLNARQLRDLYRQALIQGKRNAQNLIKRLPRPRLLPRKRQPAEVLPPPPEIPLLDTAARVCSECGQSSAPDAHFCQYCGRPL